jgi:hypothetical protein
MDSNKATLKSPLKSPYPSLIKNVHRMKLSRLVLDPSIPDKNCTILRWSDKKGEHVFRFLKKEYDISSVRRTEEQFQKARLEVKAFLRKLQLKQEALSEKIEKLEDEEKLLKEALLKKKENRKKLLDRIQQVQAFIAKNEETRDRTDSNDKIEALMSKPLDMSAVLDSFSQEIDPVIQEKVDCMKSIFAKNFSQPEKFFILLLQLYGGKLNRNSNYNIIIVTGPYCSGKSLIIDVIDAFLGKDKCLRLPETELNDPNFASYVLWHSLQGKVGVSANYLRLAAGKELLMFHEVSPKSTNDISPWNRIVSASYTTPILIGILEDEMDMIPPEDQAKCIIMRCEHELALSERDHTLRNKVQWIADTYRSIFEY